MKTYSTSSKFVFVLVVLVMLIGVYLAMANLFVFNVSETWVDVYDKIAGAMLWSG